MVQFKLPPKVASLLTCELLMLPTLFFSLCCYPWLAICNILYHFFPRRTNNVSYQQFFDTVTKKDKQVGVSSDVDDSQRLSDIYKNDYNNPLIQRRHEIIKRVLQLWSLKVHDKFYSVFTKNLKFDDPVVSYWNKNQFECGFNTLGALFKSHIIGLDKMQSDIKENFFDVKQQASHSDTREEVSEVFNENRVIVENYVNAIIIKMSVRWSLNHDLVLSLIPKFVKTRLYNLYHERAPQKVKDLVTKGLDFYGRFSSVTTREVMVLKLCRMDEKGNGSLAHQSDSEEKEESIEASHGNETNNHDFKEYVCHIMELWEGKWFLQLYGISQMTRRITAVTTYPACFLVSKLFQLWMQFK